MENYMSEVIKIEDKYKDKAIRFIDKTTHYELIFTDEFVTPSSGTLHSEKNYTLITDIVTDMRNADKDKELHIFIGSYGGAVACLNMIFQQVLSFNYRVGINLGMADSCGWMLYFTCHERYTSTFSQFMYHEMSGLRYGKIKELEKDIHFCKEWWNELFNHTFTKEVLTQDELKLGETSEVWLTGAELIKRGKAKDYSEYAKRKIPVKLNTAYEVDGKIYIKEDDKFIKYQKSPKSESLTYKDLIKNV
jgi:ATP-dependent protease ClpP protease subunit